VDADGRADVNRVIAITRSTATPGSCSTVACDAVCAGIRATHIEDKLFSCGRPFRRHAKSPQCDVLMAHATTECAAIAVTKSLR
jgi:hypothetical protein